HKTHQTTGLFSIFPKSHLSKTSATDRSPIYSNGKGELPNELSLYGRVESTSTYIKSVAPDHLITVGYQGKKGTVALG
ncbi:hypothetical protein PSTT_13452, partial [Puccinia striiformis]